LNTHKTGGSPTIISGQGARGWRRGRERAKKKEAEQAAEAADEATVRPVSSSGPTHQAKPISTSPQGASCPGEAQKRAGSALCPRSLAKSSTLEAAREFK